MLRDRFLLEVRRCRRVMYVLRACTAMRLGLQSRLVGAAPGHIRAVVRRLRSVRPALLESTATRAGFLRRPELAVRARFLQPELPKRSVCPVLPASTAIRRGWASRPVTAVRGPFPPEARRPLRARPVLLACFAMLLVYQKFLVSLICLIFIPCISVCNLLLRSVVLVLNQDMFVMHGTNVVQFNNLLFLALQYHFRLLLSPFKPILSTSWDALFR